MKESLPYVVIPDGLRPRDIVTPIELAAVEEINAELRLAAVAEAKQRLLAKMEAARWWHRLVPFKISIERRV